MCPSRALPCEPKNTSLRSNVSLNINCASKDGHRMECKSIVVCIVVGILGLISTAVGLAFEVTPDNKLVHLFYFAVNYNDYCTDSDCVQCLYFRSTAFFLVVGSIICLFVAQIIITISTDCGCCSGRVYSSFALQTLGTLGFLFSWLAFIAAIIVYLIGGATQYGTQFPEFGHFFTSLGSIWVDTTHCYKVKHGLFGAAAAFSFGTIMLGIVSYLVSTSGNDRRRMQGRSVNANDHQGSSHGQAPAPMDHPIAIALPDVPATPVRRVVTVQSYRNPTQQHRTPVMVQA